MFHNLIESQSHRKEFKRRSSFFLFTVAAYAVILFGAGIASIYAYDAQLEAQASGLDILGWVPPVTPAPPKPAHVDTTVVRRTANPTAAVDPNITVAERRNPMSSTDDPRAVPDHPGTAAVSDPPVTGPFRLSGRDADPQPRSANSDGCIVCPTNSTQTVLIPEKPPEPPVVKPPTTQHVTSSILQGKALSLPQPMYPRIAKDAHVQGPVNIQILVSEDGKVLSAQVVSGNAMLITAARDAAMRARFSPTMLNGQPVKIQGVITYNFVLQ